MAAPVAGDLWVELGSSGVPTNDTDSIGGSPTGSDVVDSTPNLYFDDTPAPPWGDANKVQNQIIYRRCTVGAARNCKLIGHNLLADNPAGTITFTAGPGDAGKKVLQVGVASGALAVAPDNLTTLVDGTATTLYSFDVSELWRLELMESDGATPAIASEEILVSRGGTALGRFAPGASVVTREYRAAVASAKNTALSAADRLHAPSGVGALSPALSADGGVSCPDLLASGNSGAGDFVGIHVQRTLRAGAQPPKLGYVPFQHDFQFDAEEV